MATHVRRLPRRGQRGRGQALVEFAIVAPVLLLMLAGIIQFGLLFWAQNSLNQIARDTGRWAASYQACNSTGATTAIVNTANQIANRSTLFGYTSAWGTAATSSSSGVFVAWDGSPCPPPDNQHDAWVTVTINTQVPIFFPWVPGNGNISSSTEFRMEPTP